MSTAREKFFICTLTNRSRTVSRQIRAWDERQALLQFREALEDEGLPSRGTIVVEDSQGQPGRQREYQADATA